MLREDGDTEWHASPARLHGRRRAVRRAGTAPDPGGPTRETAVVGTVEAVPRPAPPEHSGPRHVPPTVSPDARPQPQAPAAGPRVPRARVATILVVAVGDLAALGGGLAVADAATDGVLVACAMLAMIVLAGGYRLPISLRAEATLPGLLPRVALGAMAIALVADAARPLLAQGVVTLLLLAVARCATYQAVRTARRRGRLHEPAVVLGDGVVAAEVRRIVAAHPEYGLDLVGEPTGRSHAGATSDARAVPDPHAALRGRRGGRLIVAFSETREADLVDLLRVAVSHSIDVYVVPRFFDVVPAALHRDVDELWGIPLQRLRPSPVRTVAWGVKRAFDIVTAGTLLALTLPLTAVIGLAVRLSSPGPVLFRQQRVGQHGRPFDMYKFRSMYVSDWSDVRWAPGAPAVTTVGRVLRRTNLDELPQLWNVLRGHMSLVGPRPERIHFVEQFQRSIPGYAARHRVPVGVTGLAQVNGLRGDTSIPERIRFDNRYIEHWSLWRDAAILTRTLAQILKGS